MYKSYKNMKKYIEKNRSFDYHIREHLFIIFINSLLFSAIIACRFLLSLNKR